MLPRAYAVIALLAAMPFAAAQAGAMGASSISFSTYSVYTSPGGSAVSQYTVSLVKGVSGNTTIEVPNRAGLSRYGINVTLSAAGGALPLTGTVTISVAPTVPEGKYRITLIASGSDPSIPAAIALNVIPYGAHYTTTALTTAPAVTTTVAQGGTGGGAGGTGGQEGRMALYVAIAAVAVLFAVIAAALRFSGSRF